MSGAPGTPPASDLITMARFLVMPGAERLLDAFSRIPPGPLRDSVISHAEVMADTYSGAPVENQMPDPLQVAALHSPVQPKAAALALPGPGAARSEALLESPETRAVKLRMEGVPPQVIAEQLDVNLSQVELWLREARKGGAKWKKLPNGAGPSAALGFPLTAEAASAHALGQLRRSAQGLGISEAKFFALRRKLIEMRSRNSPIEDLEVALRPAPRSLIWRWIKQARGAGINIPAELHFADAEFEEVATEASPKPAPATARAFKEYAPFRPFVDAPPFGLLADLTEGSHHALVAAAARRGLTPEAYHKLRDEVVRRRMAGDANVTIATALNLDPMFVGNVITSVRSRGGVFPEVERGATAETPRAAPTPTSQRVTTLFEELTGAGLANAKRGGQARNITPAAYQDLRESVIQHRLNGVPPSKIALLVGEGDVFVKDQIAWAREQGVVFPPVDPTATGRTAKGA